MRTPKRTLAVLTCASALLLASSAAADTVLVKYGLVGTVALGGVPSLGPAGTGMATVEFQGTPGSGIATGPAHLVSLTWAQPGVAIPYLGDVLTIAPGFAITALASGAGTLTAFGPGGLSLPGNTGGFAGIAHCSGLTCFPGLLPVPASVPLPLTTVGTAIPLSGAVATPFSSTIALTLPLTSLGTPIGGALPPVALVVAVTGTQIGARTHIATPEPGTLPLLASAVAVAAGLAWRARRRRG